VQGAGAPAAVDAAAPEQAVSAEGQSSSMVDVDAANKQAGAMTGFSHQQQTDLQLQAQDVKGKVSKVKVVLLFLMIHIQQGSIRVKGVSRVTVICRLMLLRYPL
jgi:hypothetical protein